MISPILESLQVLDIPDSEYFGEKYRDYISNSKLRLINPDEGGSPELWKQGLQPSYSDAFLLGSAVHGSILQPDDYIIPESVDRPTGKAGFMADELYEVYKSKGVVDKEDIEQASNKIGYYKNKLTTKRIEELLDKCNPYFKQRDLFNSDKEPIFLSSRAKETLNSCLKNVSSCNPILETLKPVGILKNPDSFNELTILLEVVLHHLNKTSQLKLKGKLDNFTIDYETGTITLNDVKTTGHQLDEFKKDSFFRFHYYRQLAMYGWMLSIANKVVYKIPNPTFKCNLLLISTIPPYDCDVYPISNKLIDKGLKEFTNLLYRVCECAD